MKLIFAILFLSQLLVFTASEMQQTVVIRNELRRPNSNNIKAKALQVLQSKCNTCHYKRNRRRVFNQENMETYASEIQQQVFVKKRMPKGRKNHLSDQEQIDLKNWLNQILNIQK